MKRLLNLRLRSASRRGATVLIAILVFLLAALSGTIALTMATSNAGRYTHEKEDQQAYLAVASAAKLIGKKLESTQIKFTSKGMSELGRLDIQNSGDIADVAFLQGNTDTPIGENKKNLFFSDKRFINNIKLLPNYQGNSNNPEQLKYQPIFFELSTTETGTVQVELNMSTTIFVFRIWLKNGEHSVYQITMQVEAKWDKANWTIPDGESTCQVRMYWDMSTLKYTFEGTGLTT